MQRTRDPLVSGDLGEGCRLDKQIGVHWLDDGDHDLESRRKSGFAFDAHMAAAAGAAFVEYV